MAKPAVHSRRMASHTPRGWKCRYLEARRRKLGGSGSQRGDGSSSIDSDGGAWSREAGIRSRSKWARHREGAALRGRGDRAEDGGALHLEIGGVKACDFDHTSRYRRCE